MWCDLEPRKDFIMATVTVDKNSFKADVLDAAGPVVVDFWAEWCGPCKMIGPSLEEISTEMAGKVKITKVNIDENPEIAAQFGVRSIPTLMIFKGGEMASRPLEAMVLLGLGVRQLSLTPADLGAVKAMLRSLRERDPTASGTAATPSPGTPERRPSETWS
jgi:thioredoxin 1